MRLLSGWCLAVHEEGFAKLSEISLCGEPKALPVGQSCLHIRRIRNFLFLILLLIFLPWVDVMSG